MFYLYTCRYDAHYDIDIDIEIGTDADIDIGAVHTTATTAAPPVLVVSTDSTGKVPASAEKVDKDIRTPPPLVNEALEDIYGGGSSQEVEANDPPRPLGATQGTLIYSYTDSNVMSNMRMSMHTST